MTLRHQLIEDFNAQSIALKLTNQADLVLSFEIRSYQIKRTDYALDKTGQTYDFRFTISGSLSVFDNREKTFYLSSQTLSSTYSYITESTDLTIAETDDGRDELIDLLSKAIAEKLTDRF